VQATLNRETVWLTQDQMAQIFDVKRPAVTKHLLNIFQTKELEEDTTCSILEHMGQEDSRTYTTKYYNLDAIIEVDERQVCANFAHTAADGKTCDTQFFNLDVRFEGEVEE
jgi:hypothetical protein